MSGPHLALPSPAATAAESWIKRGCWPVPIPSREKKPVLDAWQHLRITHENLDLYFNGAAQNIGVLLGDDNGLADVDLDSKEALLIASEFLPDTGLIFGHKSKPASHYFYRTDPPIITRQFKDPLAAKKNDQAMIVELRGRKSDNTVGLQTVVPPSIHRDTGEPITFEPGYDRDPAKVKARDLGAAVSTLAATVLLARHWPKEGLRHHAFLALAGTLARSGVEAGVILALHRGIYRVLWPTNADFTACASEINTTLEKEKAGSPTTAFSTLSGLLNPVVLKKALEWLNASQGLAHVYDRRGPDTWDSIPYPQPIGAVGFHGIAGEYIRLVEPHTEADPNFMLLYFLCAAGNVIGRGPHVRAGGDQHSANLYVCAVGSTSSGRKGSATAPVEILFRTVDNKWSARIQAGGLSSGEGLVYAVRDPTYSREETDGRYREVESDPGVLDKRLFVRQSEFHGALQNMKRNGNNLSAMIRDGWDRGELNSMTKNSPLHATNAHISIVASITPEELRRSLADEIDNGFANRFLWCCSKRSKYLPSGGRLFDLDLTDFRNRFGLRLDQVKKYTDIRRDPEAEELWGRDNSNRGMYAELCRERPGLFGAVTARAAPQVLRLALILALLDGKDLISATHLTAAREIWRYCEESARFIFGEKLQNPIANEILNALRSAPTGLTRKHIFEQVLGKHKSKDEIIDALAELERRSLARREPVPNTGGRPAELWFAETKNSAC